MQRVLILSLLALACTGVALGFFFGKYYHSPVPVVSGATPCPSTVRESHGDVSRILDDAYSSAPIASTSLNVKGILVPRDSMAARIGAMLFNDIATTAPVTVILVAERIPNASSSDNIVSDRAWQTPYGVLGQDCTAIKKLAQTGLVSVDESSFDTDHDLSFMAGFIKHSLPQARVVPILVADSLDVSQQTALAQALYQIVDGKVLIVASANLSHGLPRTVANFHDAKTISVLKDFDHEGIEVVDSSSTATLGLSLRYLEQVDARQFVPLFSDDSAMLQLSTSTESVTSYVGGTFSVGPSDTDTTATILAFGDLMLDRIVRARIASSSLDYPFEPIKHFLWGSDIVVANAEGAFTSSSSISIKHLDRLLFTFDPSELPVLHSLGFTLFSEANNHALNFGASGLQESEDSIKANDMSVFGDPTNEDPRPYYETIRGVPIAFIGYHQFLGTDTQVRAAIKEAHDTGAFVVVYPHWGIEYSTDPSGFQRKEAHAFIDDGADLILGSHPHVIEPIEFYKGKVIFYSMGNFVFDQSNSGPTSQGLSVGIVIASSTVTYSLFPLSIHAAQVSLMSSSSREVVQSWLSKSATLETEDTDLRGSIAHGVFTVSR